jgi:hypothetical protein
MAGGPPNPEALARLSEAESLLGQARYAEAATQADDAAKLAREFEAKFGRPTSRQYNALSASKIHGSVFAGQSAG